MSESALEPVVIDVPEAPSPEFASFPFVLADDLESLLVATRPKMAVLTEILAALGSAEKNPLVAGVQIERLIGQVLDEPSTAHVRARLQDPKDSLDLDVLAPIMKAAVKRWYPQGPTGSRSGSKKSRGRSGTSSTGRRR